MSVGAPPRDAFLLVTTSKRDTIRGCAYFLVNWARDTKLLNAYSSAMSGLVVEEARGGVGSTPRYGFPPVTTVYDKGANTIFAGVACAFARCKRDRNDE